MSAWGIPEWLAYTWAVLLFLGVFAVLTAYMVCRD